MFKINLYWYKHEEGHGNFGDELNPYLVGKLSGKKVQLLNIEKINNSKWLNFKILIYKLINGKYSIKDCIKSDELNYILNKKGIFAIGSVIGWYSSKNIIVWGSGILSQEDKICPAKFLAVRGKYTQQKLEDLGYKAPKIIGDPALLLPLVKRDESPMKNGIAIIPHYIHYDFLKSQFKDRDVLIINMLDDIEVILNQIQASTLTLSTSLHGIIVSHAYGVPSLWVKYKNLEKRQLSGDNIKFYDYFSSVNIPEYSSVDFSEIEDFVFKENVSTIINNYSEKIIPKSEKIKQIQRNLLTVAPFPILKKYK